MTDSETTTTLEGHQVGAGIEGSKAGVTGKVEYQYTNQTTEENRHETSNTTRNLNRSEVSQHFSKTQGQTIDSASLAMTARITNTGDVAFKVSELAPILVSVGVDGSKQTFDGFKQAGDGTNQPSLAPGQSAEIVYTIGDIGAVDGLALAEDSSSLVMSVGAVKLSQIGIDGFQADSGDFARYTDRIKANTAAVSLDLRPGKPTQTYLVSTSFRRDANGRPAGTTLCDALQMMLGRKVKLTKPQSIKFGKKRYVTPVLKALGNGAGGRVKQTRDQYFVLDATRAATKGKKVFAVPDVTLRGGQAARIVTFRDADEDGVESRDELAEGSDDKKPDTDGDGITDLDELTVIRDIKTQQPGDPAVRGDVAMLSIKRRTSPVSADTDGDGDGDAAEIAAGTDPEVVDTDGDGAREWRRHRSAGGRPDARVPLRRRLVASPTTRVARHSARVPGAQRSTEPTGRSPTSPERRTRPSRHCRATPASCWCARAGRRRRRRRTTRCRPAGWTPAHTRSSLARSSRQAGSMGNGKQRIQWLVGQPGGLIVELEEYDTVYAVNAVQSNCIGNDVACPAKTPFKLTLGGYSKQAAGQWLPVALVVWPGKSGDTLGTNVRLRIPGAAVVEGFAPDRAHGETNSCVMLFGARSGSCDGSQRFTGGERRRSGFRSIRSRSTGTH